MLTDNSDTTPTHISNSYTEPSSPSSVASMEEDDDNMAANVQPGQMADPELLPDAAGGAPGLAPLEYQPSQTPPEPSPDVSSQAIRDRLIAEHIQQMTDAQRELAHLRAQLAALAAQNDAAQRTQADLVARNAEAERTLENTVQAAAQHAQDQTTDRVVHADVAKRMVHAPTVTVDIKFCSTYPRPPIPRFRLDCICIGALARRISCKAKAMVLRSSPG